MRSRFCPAGTTLFRFRPVFNREGEIVMMFLMNWVTLPRDETLRACDSKLQFYEDVVYRGRRYQMSMPVKFVVDDDDGE